MKDQSQNDRVLQYIQRHGSITPMEALKRLGVFRLGARIHDLKHRGERIASVRINRNGKWFSQYEFEK